MPRAAGSVRRAAADTGETAPARCTRSTPDAPDGRMLATTGPDARRIAWTTPRLHPRTRGSFRGSLLARSVRPEMTLGVPRGAEQTARLIVPCTAAKTLTAR